MGIQYTESRDVDFGQVSRILAFSIGVRDDWDGERTKEAFLNSTGRRLWGPAGRCPITTDGR